MKFDLINLIEMITNKKASSLENSFDDAFLF